MALRGLREKILYVHNPLPAMSDKALNLAADSDFEVIEASEKPQLLSWVWKYDAGLNFEQVRLAPDDFVQLRQKEAEAFIDQFGEQGAVSVEDPEDVAELRAAKIKGLLAAQRFFLERGTRRAQEYRKKAGIGKEELLEMKLDHWPWYRNQHLASVIIAGMLVDLRKPESNIETPRDKKRKR